MKRIVDIENKIVKLSVGPLGDPDGLDGREFLVEGYWDDITGQSWMMADGNFAALKYAMRSGVAGLPIDDNVLYGKVDGLGHLIHQSEIVDEALV